MTFAQLTWLLPWIGCWLVAFASITRTGSRFRFRVAIAAAVAGLMGQGYVIFGATWLHGWVTCRGDWTCSAELDRCRCSHLRLYAALVFLAVECVATVGLIIRRRSRLATTRNG